MRRTCWPTRAKQRVEAPKLGRCVEFRNGFALTRFHGCFHSCDSFRSPTLSIAAPNRLSPAFIEPDSSEIGITAQFVHRARSNSFAGCRGSSTRAGSVPGLSIRQSQQAAGPRRIRARQTGKRLDRTTGCRVSRSAPRLLRCRSAKVLCHCRNQSMREGCISPLRS